MNFFFVYLFPFLLAPAHDFHLSKCLIEYSEADQALQISLHVFIDDLEETLARHGVTDLYLGTAKEDPLAEKHLTEYVRKVFQIKVNGEATTFKLLGKEVSDDLIALWCYFEVPDVHAIKTLFISNTILLESFDDQTNMVSVLGPDKKKGGFLFRKGKTEGEMEF